jgi:hypothetical protein
VHKNAFQKIKRAKEVGERNLLRGIRAALDRARASSVSWRTIRDEFQSLADAETRRHTVTAPHGSVIGTVYYDPLTNKPRVTP